MSVHPTADPRPTVLAIDTSSDVGSAAVRKNGRLAAELRLPASLQHSAELFAAVEKLQALAGVTVSGIDLFVAARGPGSFTGLRVGLAAVEGFAFATRARALGISTLSAIAWKVGPVEGVISPVLDARRGEIYGALFRRNPTELVEVRAPCVRQPARWRDSLPDGPVVLCGPGAAAHRAVFEQRPECRIEPGDPFLAAAIAELAEAGHREPLEPLYVRASDAKMSQDQPAAIR